MGTCKALLVAGVAVFGAAGAAFAADLPPPPPIDYPQPEPVSFGGWYLRGDVGVGIASSPDLKSTFDEDIDSPGFDQQSLGDAAFVGVGVGYQFNSWIRFDVTGEYRTSQSLKSIESYGCASYGGCLLGTDSYGTYQNGRAYDRYDGSVQSTVALFNAYADIGTWYGITPFVGAGIGGSFNRITGLTDVALGGASVYDGGPPAGLGGFGYAKTKNSMDLAYALMAGLSYAVTPNLKLELAYRYLNMGNATSNPISCYASNGCTNEVQKIRLESQDIKLGMRWLFTDIAPIQPAPYYPPPPPPPIVRKY